MESTPPRVRLKFALALCGLLIVASCCAESVLYSNIAENDANEMMAVLLQEGVSCTKVTGAEGKWTLNVRATQFAQSVDTLRKLGYPRDSYVGMGEVFQKSGLVSSPTEERIRFMHALSQELSSTLSRIDGVVSARVHIVLPNNNPFGDEVRPSSAAVFIKHRPNANLEESVTQIKKIVASSIEGLDYEQVTTTLFAADESQRTADSSTEPKWADILSVKVALDSQDQMWQLILGLSAVGVLSLIANVILIVRMRRPSAGSGGKA